MTIHIEREHQSSVLEKPSDNNTNVNNNKQNIPPEKRNNVNNPSVSTYENHPNVVIGPRNVSKTYYILKILENIGNTRPIHIITRSSNQYPNYKSSNKIKPIDKYKGSVVIFDDMLGDRNSSQLMIFSREEDVKI